VAHSPAVRLLLASAAKMVPAPSTFRMINRDEFQLPSHSFRAKDERGRKLVKGDLWGLEILGLYDIICPIIYWRQYAQIC
jgi:hypothetical protein